MSPFALWRVWQQDKTRTFKCPKCTHALVLPVDCLKYCGSYYGDPARVTFAGDIEPLLKCSKCGQALGELMAFAKRYGLLGPERPMKPRVDRKRQKAMEPSLKCRDFIQSYLGGDGKMHTRELKHDRA